MSKISISIQETSNPKIIKFETDSFLTKYESFEFANIDDAKNSPLAQQLFHLPFVKKVYISGNFVAIERYDIIEWSAVQTEVSEHPVIPRLTIKLLFKRIRLAEKGWLNRLSPTAIRAV